MGTIIGFCPKCYRMGCLTRHHWLPQRFYGKTGKVLFICHDCHREIEKILPLNRKLQVEEYRQIHKEWLRGNHPNIPKQKQRTQRRSHVTRGNKRGCQVLH